MWNNDGTFLIAPLGTKLSKVVTKYNKYEENAFESDVGKMVAMLSRLHSIQAAFE